MSSGTVRVRLYAAARAAAGQAEFEASAGVLAEVLDVVRGACADPERFAAVLGRCSFLVDGSATHGNPAELPVRAGACVDVLPPFAGG